MITSESGTEDEVTEELNKIENVKEAHSVYGMYDVVVKVEADTMDQLKNVVHKQIRGMNKVRSTLTMIVIEGR